jgi:BirA family transcriptional regulator, biotin operon repressor / biotin---[acetyl-CoA-carboxylase] ligase
MPESGQPYSPTGSGAPHCGPRGMAVFTDNRAYGEAFLPAGMVGRFSPCGGDVEAPERELVAAILGTTGELYRADHGVPGWRHILASDFARGSQYDRLIRLVRESDAPDRVACVARTGTGFHGFRQRSWSASAGNIHLTVHFSPNRPIPRFETVFTALAAVAVADAIDGLSGLAGRARIKWVNDVLVDGTKVAGVLAYTQTRSDTVTSVILGIGLNVEATPNVERSPFVPVAGSLRAATPDPSAVTAPAALRALLGALDRRYGQVLAQGYGPIMDEYRARSALVGRDVTICAEDGDAPVRVLAAGRVTAVGDGLEVYLDGRAEPVTKGRLILHAPVEGVQ